MAGFMLSPGVQVVEKDLTSIVPAVSTSVGAFAGVFNWGPVMEPTTVSSENELAKVFGAPDDSTATSFFSAANFLAYSNNLLVTRVSTTGQLNACVTGTVTIDNEDDYQATTFSNGQFAAKYPGSIGNSLKVSLCDSGGWSGWTYASEFDGVPSTNELHVIVVDEDGLITGTPDTVLEKFAFVSKASDATRADGTNIYYASVINNTSKWIWWLAHPAGGTNWGNVEAGTSFTNLTDDVSYSLTGGANGLTDATVTDADKQDAYALYADSEKYDISLIIAGKASASTAAFIINNVVDGPAGQPTGRRDCLVFISPQNTSTGAPIIGSDTATADDIIAYKAAMNVTSSYAVMDSGYKYQYDRYNDKYRWVPLNGDIAGLCARTDFTDDPWFSPAGYNRGQVKNVVKLAYNPNRTARDNLYKNGINSVVNFPGQGTVLFGDKTMLSRPSAFDRINVRRLFIVLEKAIATAAKFQLFEFNDQFTRAQFRSIVEPFLRDVQGRRGVTDFRVKCDETNNTAEVIDSNRFVADIFIKPARSINFITLNFIAARTGVSFEEIGG